MPNLVLLPLLSASVGGFANENHRMTQFVGGTRCHRVHLRRMCLMVLSLPSVHALRQTHQCQTSTDSIARVPCVLISVDTSPLLNSISGHVRVVSFSTHTKFKLQAALNCA